MPESVGIATTMSYWWRDYAAVGVPGIAVTAAGEGG